MYLLLKCRIKWAIPSMMAVITAAVLLLCQHAYSRTVSADTDTVALPVIMYHGLHPDRAQQGAYVVSPKLFEDDLRWLTSHGYTTVTVAQLIRYVQQAADLPEKPVLLTFDDGYLNNHLYGTPLLQTYRCQAVISPICSETVRYSGLSNRNPTYAQVTWDDLREMQSSGCWEIQNHTYALHTLKGRCGSSRLKNETLAAYTAVLDADIPQAQALFLRELGVSPTAFFYPFGAIGEGQLDILKNMGFCATFTCTARVNTLTRDAEALYELGRFRRPCFASSEQFFTRTVGLA